MWQPPLYIFLLYTTPEFLFEAEESEIKDIMERIFTQYRKEYKGTSLLPKYEYISMMKEEKKETQV